MANEPPRRDRSNLPRNTGNGSTNVHGNVNLQGPYGGWSAGGLNANEQVRDILHVVFKRKRLIAAVLLAITLPGVSAMLMRKPSYVATAKVMISTQRTDPTVQPTDVTRLDDIRLNESLVNSEVHVIGSREVLEHVVRNLAFLGNGTGPVGRGKGPSFGEQVLSLSRSLAVTPIKASNVIQIDYRAAKPGYAALVVNRVVDEYLAYHASIHGNKGLPRFYDEQQRLLEQRMRKAEDVLATFSRDNNIVSPKEELLSSVRTINEVGAALRDVSTNILGTEERVRAIREQIAEQPEVVKRSQYLEVNPVITQLSTQLVDRQVDRVTLLQKYTEEDRHVRDNANEIAELTAQINREVQERPTVIAHQLLRVNSVREERVRTLLDLESSLKDQRARQATLEDELSRANRRLMALQGKSLEYDRLDQELRMRRETYDLYVKREQEARLSNAMDEQKLVNVDVVQRPALPLPRADTQGASIALLVVAGLVLAVAAAFAREYMTRSLRTEYDVGRHLGLPLLGSIGDVSRA